MAHPDHLRFRGMHRDNSAVAEGKFPLRYGPGDIAEYPCHVALQVAAVLMRGRGQPVARAGRSSG